MPLIGNKVTEKDIRDYLTENGYYGRTAKIVDLKLVAVQRPGWLQVFRFDLRAKQQDGDWVELFGTCRDDEAAKLFEVSLSQDATARDLQIEAWSDGLIALGRRESHWLKGVLLTLFAFAMLLAIAGALFGE